MNWKRLLKNEYFIVTAVFLVWMLLLDENSLKNHLRIRKELIKLKSERAYYKEKISEEGKRLFKLKYDKDEIEKVAREKYYMKRKDEALFLIK